ncbi:MAG TPA: peptidylprolyl isomerase [Noviherbaspirillum sp.]
MKNTFRFVRHTALLSALILSGQVSADAPLAAAATAAASTATSAPAETAAAQQEPIFARMGDDVITFDEYNSALDAAARGKFYHGKAPENEVAKLQREVADKMIVRVMVLREARRRGIQPDQADIQKTLDGYERRYGNSDHWKTNRAQILPGLTARLEDDSRVKQFEKAVRNVPEPERADVEAYYKEHPDKFTEPERLRVSSILLRVDPAAPHEIRLKAEEAAKELHKKLVDGADFAEMARENSDDRSSIQGGDLGYLHKGMVPVIVQDLLASMKAGEISQPVHVLEGVTILKLTERVPAKLHDFERVQDRARALLRRDRADAAWANAVAELKKANPAQVDDSGFLPLVEDAEAADKSATPK